MDYGKHLFELKKSVLKALSAKSKNRFRFFGLELEEGDYQVKLRNLKRFLEEGDKAKVSLRFRGRSSSF